MKGYTITLLLTGLLASMLPVVAHGNTRTWNGTTGNWTDAARWGGTVPQPGETAVVNSGSITLDATTADLAAFTMSGGTLTFVNWDTALTATNVTVSGGAFTLPLAFTDTEMSNRVYVVCSSFTLGASATINVDNRGFKASTASLGTAYGPGAPADSGHYGAGAGHGGVGGYGDSGPTPGGPIYGQTNAPTVPGSGGGGVSGGNGGGAVRIDAVGTVTIDGTITAKGGNVATVNSHGGAGSGGSIFISCARFAGAASGRLIADGGRSTSLGQTVHGGSGGGGRIAVAIGVSATDVQKLIDGDPVDNVFTTDRCAGYAGSYSVAKGVPLWLTGEHNHEGEPGTVRFVATSSDTLFWLRVDGDQGAYGSPEPYDNGINVNIPAGTVVTNTVVTPYDAGGGIGWGFLGWSVTNQAGAAIADGTSTQAVFTVSTNMVLTYQWTNMYQLSVTSAVPAQGSVNPGTGEGWYTNGVSVSGITATPEAGYVFNRWTGSGVPAGQETNSSLTAFTMTEPRLLVANFSKVDGETKTWSGTGTWDESGKWTPAGIPGPADAAVIGSGTLTLREPRVAGSLTINSGTTLIFTNWNTKLTATGAVTVAGTVTTPAVVFPPFYTETDMTNRVHFVCGHFTVADGGQINVAARGYRGSPHWTVLSGDGPGKGMGPGYYGGGAGHGGAGADGSSGDGGPIYGMTNAPLNPGSSGGGNRGGHGGGAVLIDASGGVTIDGLIDTSGGNFAGHGGGGSGGSIFILCDTLQGSASGTLRAAGGHGGFGHAGGGGGGRIAVAIGMSEAERQELIDTGTVDELLVTAAHPDYYGDLSVTNGWSVNASLVPQGRPGEMGTARFVQVLSGYTLVVQGDPGGYAVPTPYAYGIHPNIDEDVRITNTVISLLDQGGGIGWGALGWSVTNAAGAVMAEGAGNQAVFDMTTNAVLTFFWTNMYQLAVSSAIPAQGSVDPGPGEGWYTNGVAVAGISATPASGYVFNRWTGTDVPAGQETDNPLATVMTAPRLLTAHFSVIGGETKTWSGSGNWLDTGNWSPAGMPGSLDDAHIVSGTLTVSEPHITGSLALSNGATMMFTNWTAKVNATRDITLAGLVTLPNDFKDGAMSNRVNFAGRNFSLTDDGLINVAAKGFHGAQAVGVNGHGPGKGLSAGHYGGGGGHGGVGGDGLQGVGGGIYGVTNMPTAPGSGGGGNRSGHGGGAVFIDASGHVTIDGTIDANGGHGVTGQHGSGGSGGSIFIAGSTFKGAASGVLRANGGNGITGSSGAGAGGRIAVAINTTAAQLQWFIDNDRTAVLAVSETYPDYMGVFSANGSIVPEARAGGDGTKRFLIAPPRGTIIRVR